MKEEPILTAHDGVRRVDWYRNDTCVVTIGGRLVIARFDGRVWSVLRNPDDRDWALTFRDEANRRTLDEGAW